MKRVLEVSKPNEKQGTHMMDGGSRDGDDVLAGSSAHSAGVCGWSFSGGRNEQEQEGDGGGGVLSPAARDAHIQELSSSENTSIGGGFLFFDRNSKQVDGGRR